MKTVKIIDLLNLVYEGKAPKKIKFKDDIYEYKEERKGYINTDTNNTLGNDYSLDLCLNDEVEIIEDKPSKIDKLDYKYKNMYGRISDHRYSELEIIDKVNELTNAVNYILEKRDSND